MLKDFAEVRCVEGTIGIERSMNEWNDRVG